MRLKNKRALITGAARGIGEQIARSFADQGAEVILTDILTILNERSEKAYNEFTRLNELESMLESK